MSSSISRQLVLWLAVPLMLLALCGALVHYFNSVAPGVISSDQRLKEAANVLMARLQPESGALAIDTDPTHGPPLPARRGRLRRSRRPGGAAARRPAPARGGNDRQRRVRCSP